MAGKIKGRPAMVEDYNEECDDIVPESRQVANTAAKVVTRSDHRFPAEPLIDGASDSGYSSRTAATANSTQSAPSGGKSPPVPLKLHMPKQRVDPLDRKASTRRDRKEKDSSRPGHDESMRVGAYPGSAQYHSHVPRSPSKSRRRDSTTRHYPDAAHYYEGGPVYHQSSTPIDRHHPNMEYPPSYFGRPPMPDFVPSSPHAPYAPRHAYGYEEYHRTSSRPNRSSHAYRHPGGYHQDHGRPMSMSFHEMSSMGPPGMYAPQVNPYDYGSAAGGGPPPSSSAYYASSPYGGGSFTGYAGSDFTAPMDYPPERSPSRTREPSRARRGSLYDRRIMDDEFFPADFEDMEPIERFSSREMRGRHSSKPSQGRDEDYYRSYNPMPPPPPPMSKARAAPKIHQSKRPDVLRKSQTSQAIPPRRSSRAAEHPADYMDVSDLRHALPDDVPRRISREASMMPDRTQSMRESTRRSMSYHDTGRGARVEVQNSRRRRPERSEQYYYEDRGSSRGGDLEDQVSNAEEYQNIKAGRSGAAALPPSTESLIPKMANGAGSDNGSRKSGSNSSRESGSGSKAGADKNISLMMDGIQLGFKEEAVQGKMINIRSDDAGGFHLSLGGSRRPKAYLPTGSSYSDKTGTASRRELVEDVRRPREDRRLERGSRRSSQSTYGRRY